MSTFYENGIASSSSGGDNFITKPIVVTGTVTWVDSVSGNNANAGTEEAPVATLAQAITNATTNNGDLIIIKSGHTETLSAAIVVSKTLRIFGLGSGSSAPNFTVAAAVDGIQVTSPGVEINNLYFPVGTTATNTSRIKIDATRVHLKNCTFQCGAKDASSVVVSANGLYALIESCSFTVTASGPTSAISVASALAVSFRVKDSSFNGGTYNFTSGAIYSTVANTGFVYDGVTLTNKASIIHTGGAKGYATNISASNNCRVSV